MQRIFRTLGFGFHAGALAVASALILAGGAGVFAADKNGDLGGNCCADLEERIAKLEATTANKGNTKVKLTITGQINKAVMYWDGFGATDTTVTENSSAESFITFKLEAKIAPKVTAGGVIEIGVGGYDNNGFGGYGPLGNGDTNGIYTRQSFVFIEGEPGRVAVGLTHQATDGITNITTANTNVAARMLSVAPIVGPQFGDVLDIFDGTRANIVRYDTPNFDGFTASGSWGNADLTGNGQVWDIALTYKHDWGQFLVQGGVGYRQGLVVPTFGATEDIKVLSGSGSIMYMPMGVFATGAFGKFEGSGPLAFLPDIKGWQVQGGVEERWSRLGKTTTFVEYGQLDLEGFTGTPTVMGVGVVQAVDAVAMDLYLSWRRYDLDGGPNDTLDTLLGGARIKF